MDTSMMDISDLKKSPHSSYPKEAAKADAIMSNTNNRPILQPRSVQSRSTGSYSQSRQPQPQSWIPRESPNFSEPKALHEHTFEDQRRINSASIIREENELLIWKSIERNESLPQTKMHYDRQMLLLDSDDEDVEWEESYEDTSEDERRLRPGVIYGPKGWWDPRVHSCVEDRLEEDAKRRSERAAAVAAASAGAGKGRVKVEDGGFGSPGRDARKRRSPGSRRKSSGKRAAGASSSQG